VNLRVPIHLGGRGEKEASLLGFGHAERFVGPEGADLEGLDGKSQVIPRAGRRSKVADRIHRAVDFEVFGHVLTNELKSRMAPEVPDVLLASRDEIIDTNDFVSPAKELVDEVGSDEAGPARDDRTRHGVILGEATGQVNAAVPPSQFLLT